MYSALRLLQDIICKNFPSFCELSFQLVVPFKAQKFLILVKLNISIFNSVACVFGVMVNCALCAGRDE